MGNLPLVSQIPVEINNSPVASITKVSAKRSRQITVKFGALGSIGAGRGQFKVSGTMTLALLKAVSDADDAFVDDMAARHEAVSTRAGATRARLLFANGLYRQLVGLANAGQAAWRLTDAQKAKEYVIDPTVHSEAPKPPLPPLA